MNPEPLEICLDKVAGNEFFDEIRVGRHAKIAFNRTLRVPEDGKSYPLPAGMGRLPIHRVEDYAENVPSSWLKEGGYFIPLYQSEALFLEFNGPEWHPSIAKVCVGKINAITGESYSENLSAHKQDYVVIPEQRWLDGINSGNGVVRQFVAMPLGKGYTIEAQISDEEIHGGFQLLFMDAAEGIFPDRDPAINLLIEKIQKARLQSLYDDHYLNNKEKELYYLVFGKPVNSRPLPVDSDVRFLPASPLASSPAMGIAAGGSIKQMIISDSYGHDTWDTNTRRCITIRLINSLVYRQVTGKNPPTEPITREEYEFRQIPWFSHYEDSTPKVSASSLFKRILGVSDIDKRRGIRSDVSGRPMIASPENIQKIRTPDAKEAAEKCRKRAYECSEKSEWKRALSEISKAIDLSKQKEESDYALRCYCNFNLGNFAEGEVDGSLGLEINPESKEARSWRAYCRLSMGDHEGLKEDAEILVRNPETSIFGIQMRAEAALLSGDYQDAINDALRIVKVDPNHQRASRILTEARSLSSAEAVQENFKFDQ
jgi:tetratricopeptide (TPR) repeat protein